MKYTDKNYPSACLCHREYQIELAAMRMEESSPLARAERIARHYLAHANTAHDIIDLCQLARRGETRQNATKMALIVTQLIIDNHAFDLGIELKWESNKRT